MQGSSLTETFRSLLIQIMKLFSRQCAADDTSMNSKADPICILIAALQMSY